MCVCVCVCVPRWAYSLHMIIDDSGRLQTDVCMYACVYLVFMDGYMLVFMDGYMLVFMDGYMLVFMDGYMVNISRDMYCVYIVLSLDD